MASTVTSSSLEELFESLPTGSLDRAIYNNLRNINHRQVPGMLPSNRDMPGLTFFVRPQLNMQRDNIRNVRKLAALLSSVPTSIQTYIRCMLDPRLMAGAIFGGKPFPQEACPIVDNQMAFIPILTNNLTSISGFPSISVPTFQSKAGLYNESYTMVDGKVIEYGSFDITANFRNVRGDPILMLFYVWTLYMSYVFEGLLVPYMDMITDNRLDYNTRIYRLTLDYQKKYVTKIAACNVAIPTGVPIGDAFDISGDKNYNDANNDISMRFSCTGMEYFDPILVKEFNACVAIFNPSMSDKLRSQSMIAIDPKLINNFNFRGYPYINPATSELQWFVSATEFNNTAAAILNGVAPNAAAAEEFIGD